MLIITTVGKESFKYRFSEVIFLNPIIQFFGKISFQLFWIHQLVIRYVTTLFSLAGVVNQRVLMYSVALVMAIGCTVLYRVIAHKIKGKIQSEIHQSKKGGISNE